MTGHMSAEEFRRQGRAVVDWIADYWEHVESLPTRSPVSPGEIRAMLPAHPPQQGEPFSTVLSDMDSVIMPGITHWQHPSFFGYFPANASFPAVLADLLSSGLGVQGMSWVTSPAATELEQVVLDWLAELLDLPVTWRSTGPGGGVIQDTASTATLTALVAALHRASGGLTSAAGVGSSYTVYASREAHSSVEKAVRIAGVGTQRLRLVDVHPSTQAMDVAQLRSLMAADAAAGLVPALVVAAVGTTSTGAVDPVPAIADVAQAYGAWLHVDAAWAGVAAVCPELRSVNAGLEHADSYATNPHKWLLTNFDCDAFYVADRTALVGALSILPEYLRNAATDAGAAVDFRDWHIQLGRRFRALKLWSVIRWYGAEGLREHVRLGVSLAEQLARCVRADQRFEILAPPSLSLVVFGLRAGDFATEQVLERVNATGQAFLTHTRVGGAYAIRVAIGGTLTERRHVDALWALLQRLATELDRTAN